MRHRLALVVSILTLVLCVGPSVANAGASEGTTGTNGNVGQPNVADTTSGATNGNSADQTNTQTQAAGGGANTGNGAGNDVSQEHLSLKVLDEMGTELRLPALAGSKASR